MTIATDLLTRILEAALMTANKPLTVQHLQKLFAKEELPDKSTINEALGIIAERSDERGFELIEVASGWRFQVRTELAAWVGKLWEEKPQKYSRATLETLALIAYRQPITRGDIEEVRGVAVSSQIMRSLQERDWIKVVGHRDVPGRPALYATTREFLDYFGLQNLENLPTLAEIRDLDILNQELENDIAGMSGDAEPASIELDDKSQGNMNASESGEGVDEVIEVDRSFRAAISDDEILDAGEISEVGEISEANEITQVKETTYDIEITEVSITRDVNIMPELCIEPEFGAMPEPDTSPDLNAKSVPIMDIESNIDAVLESCTNIDSGALPLDVTQTVQTQQEGETNLDDDADNVYEEVIASADDNALIITCDDLADLKKGLEFNTSVEEDNDNPASSAMDPQSSSLLAGEDDV